MNNSSHYQVSVLSGTNSLPENESKDDDLKSNKCRRADPVFFLPQRPYMALGTLRQQLLYPRWSENSLLGSTNSGNIGMLAVILQSFCMVLFLFLDFFYCLETNSVA